MNPHDQPHAQTQEALTALLDQLDRCCQPITTISKTGFATYGAQLDRVNSGAILEPYLARAALCDKLAEALKDAMPCVIEFPGLAAKCRAILAKNAALAQGKGRAT